MGGNVLTSQRVTDVILTAFKACANSQVSSLLFLFFFFLFLLLMAKQLLAGLYEQLHIRQREDGIL